MIAPVKRGPNQIIHASINDGEFLVPTLLNVTNAR